jgi:hypothetical protein
MKIKKVIHREEGIYSVDCDFNQEEMDSIIEIGLNVLLAHGALPFTQDDTEEEDTFIVASPSSLEH